MEWAAVTSPKPPAVEQSGLQPSGGYGHVFPLVLFLFYFFTRVLALEKLAENTMYICLYLWWYFIPMVIADKVSDSRAGSPLGLPPHAGSTVQNWA